MDAFAFGEGELLIGNSDDLRLAAYKMHLDAPLIGIVGSVVAERAGVEIGT